MASKPFELNQTPVKSPGRDKVRYEVVNLGITMYGLNTRVEAARIVSAEIEGMMRVDDITEFVAGLDLENITVAGRLSALENILFSLGYGGVAHLAESEGSVDRFAWLINSGALLKLLGGGHSLSSKYFKNLPVTPTLVWGQNNRTNHFDILSTLRAFIADAYHRIAQGEEIPGGLIPTTTRTANAVFVTEEWDFLVARILAIAQQEG